MARALTLSRLAIGLAVIAPFAVLSGACGGSDTIPFDEDAATVDAARDTSSDTSIDTSLTDTSTDTSSDTITDTKLSDTSTNETSTDGSSSDGSSTDGAGNDAAEASTDASVVDASEAGDANVVRSDPRLGSVARFAVFAGSTVTNAFGTLTAITGDLGTYPDPTAIGATPPVLIGAYHLGDAIAGTARTELTTAYNNLTPASMPGCSSLTGQDLGGQRLAPGIYCFDTSAQLTGTLVLDANGDPNPEWFFQIGSTLTTGSLGASPAMVTVVGANPCKVYWQVGSSATLATGTLFSGNILAAAAITLNTGTKIVGRALAINAAVTMDTNTVSIASCP
jgi:type VI secretion system secreted protein VgrG